MRFLSIQFRSRLLLTTACFGLLICFFEENPVLGQGAPSQSLTVSIEPLFQGKRVHEGESISAPATIYIFPQLETATKPNAGDTVNVDFFEDGHKLCSEKAVWHDEERPVQRPGQAVPMWIAPAQFRVSDCVWSNAPVGSHTLTAHASGLHGLSADSVPLHVTIVAGP